MAVCRLRKTDRICHRDGGPPFHSGPRAGGHAGGPAENAGPLPESLAPKDLYVKAPYRAVVGAWAP